VKKEEGGGGGGGGGSKAERDRANKGSEVDVEINEANALRIKLGLKPLKDVDKWKSKK